jgi:hypothetical protein
MIFTTVFPRPYPFRYIPLPIPVQPSRAQQSRYYVHDDNLFWIGPYRVVTESNDRVVYLTPAQAQRFLNNWWIGTTKWVNLPWGQRQRIWQLSGRKIPADRPSVTATPLVDQTATIGQNFTYTFAANTFTNPDNSSPNYVYSARRTNGLFLPGWLTFNPLTRTFFGKPPTGSAGTYSIRVFAQDAFGRVYSDDFNIVVS